VRKGGADDLAERQRAKFDESRLSPVYTSTLPIAQKTHLDLAFPLEISLVEELIEQELQPKVAYCNIAALEGHIAEVNNHLNPLLLLRHQIQAFVFFRDDWITLALYLEGGDHFLHGL